LLLLTPPQPRVRTAAGVQVGDAGRPTYDGLKQKVQEKDAQLDEALAIIKELTEALQGVRGLCAAPLRTAECVPLTRHPAHSRRARTESGGGGSGAASGRRRAWRVPRVWLWGDC
jgi:hypothetical protein